MILLRFLLGSGVLLDTRCYCPRELTDLPVGSSVPGLVLRYVAGRRRPAPVHVVVTHARWPSRRGSPRAQRSP